MIAPQMRWLQHVGTTLYISKQAITLRGSTQFEPTLQMSVLSVCVHGQHGRIDGLPIAHSNIVVPDIS